MKSTINDLDISNNDDVRYIHDLDSLVNPTSDSK